MTGKLIGDRGYISLQLFHILWERGLHWVTKIRKNMHNKLMPMVDKVLLRKRAILETINDQIKNIQQIEHTRHRSVVNAHGQRLGRVSGLHASALQTLAEFVQK